MINSAFFVSEPVEYKGKLKIYPPSVKDVASNKSFSAYYRLLTYSQEEVEDELLGYEREKEIDRVPTPFEFLLANCYHSKEIEELTKKAFEFFCHTTVSFLYDKKKLIIGDIEELLKTINSLDELVFFEEDEFFGFQNLVRESMGENAVQPPNPNEHIRIKKMKAKSRYRDKVKAKKSDGLTFTTRMAAICCMGIGITPLNIGEISYAAMGIIMRMYQNKEKYDTDIRSLLAGQDKKKVKPVYWISNLEN